MKDNVNDRTDFIFSLVGVNLEILVSREHGGQIRSGTVVEYVYRDAVCLGIGQLVADTERWRCAFGNHDVGLTKPGGILLVDGGVTVFETLRLAFREIADMLGQDDVIPLDVFYDALVQLGILTPASDGTGEIDFLFHLSTFL